MIIIVVGVYAASNLVSVPASSPSDQLRLPKPLDWRNISLRKTARDVTGWVVTGSRSSASVRQTCTPSRPLHPTNLVLPVWAGGVAEPPQGFHPQFLAHSTRVVAPQENLPIQFFQGTLELHPKLEQTLPNFLFYQIVVFVYLGAMTMVSRRSKYFESIARLGAG